MTITKTTLKDLLRACSDLKIPFYQRGYSWDVDDVNKLLDDIYDSKTENYFLGSIILKKGKRHSYIIIDGQQRISTILLIYKSIWKYCGSNSGEIKKTLDDMHKEIKFDSANLKDGKILLKIMKSEDDSFDQKVLDTQYYKNYDAINTFITKRVDKEAVINKLYNQLSKVLLSEVIVDAEADEHILFSQINSTGKPLSTFDLTKNYLFSNISNELDGDLDKDKKLSFMVNKLSDVSKLKSNDDVIRHFIGFITADLPNKNPKNIYKSFIKLHKTFYLKKSKELFEYLYEFFFYYNYLEKKKWGENPSFYPSLSTLIESVGTYIVLIITFFSENSKIQNNHIYMTKEQELIIQNSLLILESYKFKREFYGLKENSITRYIPTVSRDIRDKYFKDFKTDSILYFFLVHKPSKDASYRTPSDDEFKHGMMETNIFNKSGKVTKSFIYRLSSYMYKEKLSGDKLTIEHVMPQDRSEWRSAGYDEDEGLVLSRVHTIGNLTLTAYNTKLSNKIFAFKKNLFRNEDSFPLNKYFIDSQNEILGWNLKEIEKRTNWLFENCQKIWSFERYKMMINENIIFDSFKEKNIVIEEKLSLDFIAENMNSFNKNKANFKSIKYLVDDYHIEVIMKNLMVYGFATEKNEFEVFGVKKNGWVSQTIYDSLNVSSSISKGKYNEDQFNEFIKSKSKDIKYVVEHIQKELL